MELTPEADARVRAAIAQAETTTATVLNRRGPELLSVRKFVAAWDALDPAARWWIQCHLADAAPDAEPADLDPGAAARAFLDESAGKQGERPDVLPMKVAVRELFVAFVEAGGAAEVGNRAHRAAAHIAPHPACQFVARHLLRLFPGAFSDGMEGAERRADSYLRELSGRDRLPTRKK